MYKLSLRDLSPRSAHTPLIQITPSPIGNILIDDSAFPFHLMPNNVALLTRSHKAIAAKKKARREQIKEITFDDEARRYVFHLYSFLSSFFLREFLTGFHKRKLAKKEAARGRAKEREKQERLEARREVCLHIFMSSYSLF